MQLRFEGWLEQQYVSEDVKRLFRESITCYKAGAYRAALLFSYLGFQAVLRERILRSPAPAGFPPGRWTAIQKDVRSEDHWDGAVFDATQQRAPDIFVLSDDLRSQVLYWKNRRNDCAHGKDDNISHPHVDGFWLFLESRLSRFVVNGSRVQLTEKIRRHFDRSVTPAGRSISALAREVPLAIELGELVSFLEELEVIFEENDDPFTGEELHGPVFLSTLLESPNDAIVERVIDFLEPRLAKLRNLLESAPPLARHVKQRPDVVRRLWYGEGARLGCSTHLLASLLSHGAIEHEQQDEAVKRAIRSLSDTRLSPEVAVTLRQFRYNELFRVVAFTDQHISQFSWANSNSESVVDFLKRNTLDADLVRRLVSTFSVPNHPYVLKGALNRLLIDDEKWRGDFLRHLAEQKIARPQYLTGLSGITPGEDKGEEDTMNW